MGGRDENIEADEVRFRSACVSKADGSKEASFSWLCFIGAVRLGSSLLYWGEPGTRHTKSRKGGGGKLGTAELEEHMPRGCAEAGYDSRTLISH